MLQHYKTTVFNNKAFFYTNAFIFLHLGKSFAVNLTITTPGNLLFYQSQNLNSIGQQIEPDGLIKIILILTLFLILLSFLMLLFWEKNMILESKLSNILSEKSTPVVDSYSNEEIQLLQHSLKHSTLILNERQQEILDLLAFGMSNKQIAEKLFISENTVKYHIKNIYQLLHVKDRKSLWLSQS